MRLKIRKIEKWTFHYFRRRRFVCRIRKLFFIFKSGNWFQSTNQQLKAIEKKVKLIAMRKWEKKRRRKKDKFQKLNNTRSSFCVVKLFISSFSSSFYLQVISIRVFFLFFFLVEKVINLFEIKAFFFFFVVVFF